MENLNNKNLNNDEEYNEKDLNINSTKTPLSLITGSITSFVFCAFSFLLSKKIALYFATHRPSNSSELVQSISTSINTLIIGLSFIATFSFGFIGLGLFIVFIRSFFIKKK